MRYLLLSSILFVSACATTSKPRVPASEAPPTGSLELTQALQQGVEPTLAYLKSQSSAEAFTGLNGRDPAAALPESLRAVRVTTVTPPEKQEQQKFIRLFKKWSTAKRSAKSAELLEGFTCEKAIESQSLAFTLEIDYPEQAAKDAAQALHEKVLTCADVPKNESYFRLAVSAIQREDCPKALEYLNAFPTSVAERGVSDRVMYLKTLCKDTHNITQRNPWGGYGILIQESEPPSQAEPAWYLQAKSGDENWDRLLMSFVDLHANGKLETIKYLSTKINTEKMRALPLPFQTSMMVMMSYAGADLSVFQTLHKYLSEHPEMASTAAAGLLFPVRFWQEIVDNSKNTDPILVKALIRQESAFNSSAKSRVKASGLMQLMYGTARIFGIKEKQQLLKPEENIRAGSEFLGQLIKRFGSVELALAAYNAGPLMVVEWKRRYQTDNIDLFVEMIPYTETREYVRLVNRNYKIYQHLLTKPTFLGSNP